MPPYIRKTCRDVKLPGERHFELAKGTTWNTDSEETTMCIGGNSAMSHRCATALEKIVLWLTTSNDIEAVNERQRYQRDQRAFHKIGRRLNDRQLLVQAVFRNHTGYPRRLHCAIGPYLRLAASTICVGSAPPQVTSAVGP